MERQQNKILFPGQETEIIRIIIKRSEHEGSLNLDLFGKEENKDY